MHAGMQSGFLNSWENDWVAAVAGGGGGGGMLEKDDEGKVRRAKEGKQPFYSNWW